MLDRSDFRTLVSLSPMPAIDFIIFNNRREVLVGKRKNAPAKGFYFVPGGRIFKNETIKSAVFRILQEELSLSFNKEIRLKGVYEHIYDDNYFGEEKLSTHYIVSVFEIFLDKEQERAIESDAQHESLIFMSEKELGVSDEVHKYVKNYFSGNTDNGFSCD